MKRLTISNIPIIIGLILSMTILYKGENFMGEIGGYWAMAVAVASVAGSLIAHLISFRKDSHLLKKDSHTIGKVKEDTATLLPEVKNIDENTKKVRDQIVEKVVPNIDQLMETKTGISLLVDELKYQNRVKQEASGVAGNMDVMINGLRSLYDENYNLAKELKKERQNNQALLMENATLRDKVKQYESKYKKRDLDLER